VVLVPSSAWPSDPSPCCSTDEVWSDGRARAFSMSRTLAGGSEPCQEAFPVGNKLRVAAL
jgi:hypothetical protein